MKFIVTVSLLSMFAAGCASFMKDLGIPRESRLKLNRATIPISCPATTSHDLALVGTSSESQQLFRDFIKQQSAQRALDFADQVVFWALFQLKVRPDFASPTARLQFLTRTQHGTRYWDFTANDDEEGVFPFFHGLTSFLEGHQKKQPLSWYAQILDNYFPQTLTIDRALEDHLNLVRDRIAADPQLRKHWFRGDELLREGERLPAVALSPIIRKWQGTPLKPVPAPPFFSYRRTPKLDVSCNYDLALYDNSIFLIDKEENRGHLFGISIASQSFLAVASQKTDAPVSLQGTALMKGSAKVRSTAFCVVQRPEGEIWLAANQSRDPGQHVYHLFRYGLGNAHSVKDLERLLKHSRHMFLSDPLRLIIESTRSREDQITELLKLNVPIYNSRAIGNIWAWAKFGENDGGFFIDDRNPGTLLCPR